MRELKTTHSLEHLSDGAKATLEITNYLGGTYYLTVDEVVVEGDHYLIQESKNSSNGFMPSIPDIKDGLFKLILFTNLDTLTLNGNAVPFSVRLKLTGQHVNGTIRLPCTPIELRHFFNENRLHCKARQIQVIKSLNEEVTSNSKLSVELGGNI